ncbi:Dymeclin [Umbelopsis sp. PMI_123]|nr:Dymeclin [Umbelopsis sp. PMI_123]
MILDMEKLKIDPQTEQNPRPKGEQLLHYLIEIILQLDSHANYSTHEFYLEALNTIIVLLSTQLHQSTPDRTEYNYFINILMTKFGRQAKAIVFKLLHNFMDQKAPPPSSSNVVYNAYTYFFSAKSNVASSPDAYPVADRSLLLLLLLSTQFKDGSSEKSGTEGEAAADQDLQWACAYRQAIAEISGDQEPVLGEKIVKDGTSGSISFRQLYSIFAGSLAIEERMLLFYLFLVENESFRVYVLSRSDPETIYIPILKLVYESIEGKTNYSQLYIFLIFILIFSQDDVFNESIQKFNVTNLTWFTERPLVKNITLGGLTMLVLLRAVQVNLSNHKDAYLHTNCMASIANMSNSMTDIHPYVAQRIVSVFELISKRYQKIASRMADSSTTLQQQPSQEIIVYQDLIALFFEIMNSILVHHLKDNPQLVYALLLKREAFAVYRLNARLSELVANLESIINYFHARVSEANLRAPSTSEVLEIIDLATRTWTPDRLKSFPELKFQYAEELDSQQFFCPYVWALVHRRTFIYWNDEKAHILDEYRLQQQEQDGGNSNDIA